MQGEEEQEEREQSDLPEGSLKIEGDGNVILQIGKLLNSIPESTQQANFYASTGIRCGKPTRQTFELLMEKHGFHSYELMRAWVTHALVDDKKTGGLRASSRALDLTIGWFGLAFFAVLFFTAMHEVVGALLTSKSQQSTILAFSLMLGYLAAIRYFVRSHLHPQQVAKRVGQALSAEPEKPSWLMKLKALASKFAGAVKWAR